MPFDAGVQAERTSMAWQRTAVAGSAVAGAVLIEAAHRGSTILLVAAAMGAAGCGFAAWVAARRSPARVPRASAAPPPTEPRADPDDPPGSPWAALIAVASIPVLVAVVQLLVVLTSR